jgi:hypothetical protein
MTWRAGFALLCAVASAVSTARAQDGPRMSLSGSVRGGYWSSTRNLDREHPLAAGMAWLKATGALGRGVSGVAEGWGALRGPADDPHTIVELREAFVTATLGAFDLRVGRQIVAWGRADGVNPTGNLAAEDLTVLTPDDADRRLGASTATASYYFGNVAVSALWIPEFRGHQFPLPRESGALFIDNRPSWPGDQWAVRIERTGGAVDWSMSLFGGLDLLPDLAPTTAAGEVAFQHHRLHVFGVDAATTLGRFGLRAEGAYVRTEDTRGTDPFTKNPFAFVVVGVDRTFDGRYNLNVQYLVRAVRHHRTPTGLAPDIAPIAEQQAILSGQTRSVQHGASMRASGKWLHETLETEWAAIAYAAPRGIAMRPKVTHAATDRVTLSLGAEVFRGQDASFFRMLRPNSATFLEARWGF